MADRDAASESGHDSAVGQRRKIGIRLGGRRHDLIVSTDAFVPSATTMLFARVVDVKPGDTVFDIGCGAGPLSIWAALEGASAVYAVDPVREHVDLAIANRDAHGLADRIDVRRGEYFDPLEGRRANVVIADVSGIADAAGRVLGWYPDNVPTGGHDGSAVICELIARAPEHLLDDGVLYFAVAVDLSDDVRILELAERTFASLAPASREFKVPLPEGGRESLERAYGGALPPFVSPLRLRGKDFWRGQVWRASLSRCAFSQSPA